jgi:anti-sigma factor RsiW
MSCSKSNLVSPYLDKEMGADETIAFEAHARGCSRCAQKLEELRALHSAFSAVQSHQAPYGFSTRVLARAAELEKKKAPWYFAPLFVRFAEAAVLLVVVTLGILAGNAMTNGVPGRMAVNMTASLSLDLFEAAPPGSLGGAYLALMEAGNEK